VSSFNSSELRSASDDNIPSENREPVAFTTATIRFNTLIQFGKLGKAARIINDDAVNTLTYRLHNPQAIARIVPASSEITINEWFAELHIIPDGTTGTGQLELELAFSRDARRIT